MATQKSQHKYRVAYAMKNVFELALMKWWILDISNINQGFSWLSSSDQPNTSV